MNNKLFGSKLACGNSERPRSKTDLYPTPPDVTVGLLLFLSLPKGTKIWDPACGEGDMVDVFEKMGYPGSSGTDILDGTDFLQCDTANGADWIITNPPFSLAEEFIEHCAILGKPFALLLKSQFWHASRRLSVFSKYQPSYVLPLSWRPDFLFKEEGKHGAPVMEVAWSVWSPDMVFGKTVYCPIVRPLPLFIERMGFKE